MSRRFSSFLLVFFDSKQFFLLGRGGLGGGGGLFSSVHFFFYPHTLAAVKGPCALGADDAVWYSIGYSMVQCVRGGMVIKNKDFLLS